MLKWKRVAPGLYEAKGKDSYQAERLDRQDYDPNPKERERWMLRVNGIPTDTERSFWILKEYAQSYEEAKS